jgi:aldose 1-epimerase
VTLFQLEESPFGPYRRYRFQHPNAGHGFDIVPAVAANVTEIRFAGTNVLDGYETPEELSSGKGGKSAILFPFPNRLRDGLYSWRGRDYAFPINNPDTNNAIHGFVRRETFNVERIELTEERAAITSRFVADGKNEAYPFPFTLKVTFAMSVKGEFSAMFVVTNHHHESIPIGLGWHPYFRLGRRTDDHSLQLPPCERIEIDDRMIPTGKRIPFPDFDNERVLGDTQLDTCFAVSTNESHVRTTLRAAGHRLFLEAQREQFPFFQVFTPPARTSIAIEPMTCNVDAFHNREGLVELASSSTWTTEFRLVHQMQSI